MPAITRKTDKGLPRYATPTSPTSSSSPAPRISCRCSTTTAAPVSTPRTVHGVDYEVARYRPRDRGPLRADRALDATSRTGVEHWRVISRDNVTTLVRPDAQSRVADPADPRRIFS